MKEVTISYVLLDNFDEEFWTRGFTWVGTRVYAYSRKTGKQVQGVVREILHEDTELYD